MILPIRDSELTHADEPSGASEYADLLTRVATAHEPIIVRRNGEDLAAVIPLEHLEAMRDSLLRQEAEELAAKMNWQTQRKNSPPDPSWFEGDEPKPF